ncbi:hypothetical protein RQN30_06555 [Arcanobacterium hippocoleae]
MKGFNRGSVSSDEPDRALEFAATPDTAGESASDSAADLFLEVIENERCRFAFAAAGK